MALTPEQQALARAIRDGRIKIAGVGGVATECAVDLTKLAESRVFPGYRVCPQCKRYFPRKQ